MASLMTHVWNPGILVIWINLAIGRFRMRALIAKGELTSHQANRFCLGAAVAVAIAGTLFGLATWLSGGVAGL